MNTWTIVGGVCLMIQTLVMLVVGLKVVFAAGMLKEKVDQLATDVQFLKEKIL